MQVHSLGIDEIEETDYVLISIHTGLEDYKLAYLLNKHVKTRFVKSRNEVEIEENNQTASFSVFKYSDETLCNDWYLIANKYHGKSVKPITNGLFGTINETVDRISYLVPEKKKTDYLIKIEGGFESYKVHQIIKQINELPKVITSYSVDVNTLKSKDFLIF